MRTRRRIRRNILKFIKGNKDILIICIVLSILMIGWVMYVDMTDPEKSGQDNYNNNYKIQYVEEV